MEEFTPHGESPQTEPPAPPRTDPADHELYQRPPTPGEPAAGEQAADFDYAGDQAADFDYAGDQAADFDYAGDQAADLDYVGDQATDYSYAAEPATDYSYAAEPVTDYRHTAEPVTDYSHTEEPVTDYRHTAEPVPDFGYTWAPMGEYSYAEEPVTDYGYAEDDTDPVGFPPIPPAPEPARAPAPAPLPVAAPVPAAAPAPVPVREPRRRRRLAVAVVVVAVALLAGAILTAALVSGPGRRQNPTASATEAVGPNPAPPGPLTGPVDGRNQAVFNLVDGTSIIHLHAVSMGDDLYRIATPTGGSINPRVEQTGADVKLYLPTTGRGGDGTVDISLNSSVRWTLRLSGGAASTVLDMTGGRVDGVELAGGATRIELTLPKPQGVVPVRMTGGVDQFLVRLAEQTPVRVRVGSGAGEVTVGGTTHRGIAPGQLFTAYGWSDGKAGVDVQAVAGMSALTVTG